MTESDLYEILDIKTDPTGKMMCPKCESTKLTFDLAGYIGDLCVKGLYVITAIFHPILWLLSIKQPSYVIEREYKCEHCAYRFSVWVKPKL